MVLRADEPSGTVWVFTKAGRCQLPEQAAEVLGADHPFLGEAAADLVALCRHPNAGDLVIVGWSSQSGPVTFSVEHGSHGGPGINETRAFALLPADAPLAMPAKYHRFRDLRQAALHFLGASPAMPPDLEPFEPKRFDSRVEPASRTGQFHTAARSSSGIPD
jgi:hypothetical protein